MINFTEIISKINSALNEREIEKQFHEALQKTDLVAMEFFVENDYLSFSFLHDSKGAGPDKLLAGLKLPAPKETKSIEKNTRFHFTDLKIISPYSDILALLTHRDCVTAAIVITVIAKDPHSVIAVGSRSTTGLSVEDVEQIKVLVDSTTANIERVRSAMMSDKLQSAYPAIVSIIESLGKEKNLTKVFESLHECIRPVFPQEINFIAAVKDENAAHINFPYAFQNNRVSNMQPHPIGEGIYSYIMENKKPLDWEDQPAQTLQKLNIIERADLPKSFFGVPIIFRDVVLGALCVSDTESGYKFSPFEKNLVQIAAQLISVYLSGIRFEANLAKAGSDVKVDRMILDQILLNSPIQISIKDQSARYLFTSNALLKRLSLNSNSEIIGKSDLNALPQAEGIDAYKDDLEILGNGQAKTQITAQIQLADGTPASITRDKYPLIDETGKVSGLIEFAWDDSVLKRTQDQVTQLQTQVSAIREIIQITSSTINNFEIYQRILTHLSESIKPYHMAIYTIDALRENILLQRATGEYGRFYEEKELKVRLKSKTIFNKVFNDLAPLHVENVENEPLYIPDPLLPETKEIYILPLISNRTINGMFEMRSSTSGFFGPDRKDFLAQIASLLSVAISNSSQSERIQETLAKQQSLYSITSAATEASSPQEALRLVVDNLAVTIPDSQPAFFIPNEKGELTVAASKGYEGIDIGKLIVKPGEGIIGQAAETLRPIRLEDVTADESFIPINPSVRSEIAVPVTFRGKLLGVLNIDNKRVNAFDQNDEQILVTLCNTLGSILSNVTLVSQIRLQAERQQQLFEISDKIRRSVDIESIIKTSAIELSKAIHARKTRIEVKPLTQMVSETDLKESDKGARS